MVQLLLARIQKTWCTETKTHEKASLRFSVVQNVVHRPRLRGADVVERHRLGRAAGDAGPPHPRIGGVHLLVPYFGMNGERNNSKIRRNFGG